jgi:hypothetical protein
VLTQPASMNRARTEIIDICIDFINGRDIIRLLVVKNMLNDVQTARNRLFLKRYNNMSVIIINTYRDI